MAAYVSYNLSEVKEKGLRSSPRKPLSVINGFKRPLRTKDGLKLESALDCNEQFIENNSKLPFTIFSDNEPAKVENAIKVTRWSTACEEVKYPYMGAYSLTAADMPTVGKNPIDYLNLKTKNSLTCNEQNSEKYHSSQFFAIYTDNTPLRKFYNNENSIECRSKVLNDSLVVPPAELPSEDPEEYLSRGFPYKEDSFAHLRRIELKYRPRPNYLKYQPELTSDMRSVLVDWMIEVGLQFEFSSECIHLAVSLTDRFLSVCEVSRNKLQLVGIASIFITAKYEEVHTQELEMYSYITDSTYTKKQILQMEQKIMHKLGFYVGGPTAMSFLHLVYCMTKAPQKVLFYGQYLCELSLLDIEPFVSYLPSLLGVASYCLARYILGHITWVEELEMTGYTLEDLKPAISSLFQKVRSVNDQNSQIPTKYSHPDFLRVAEVEPPELLVICK